MISKDHSLRETHVPHTLETENIETAINDVIATAPAHQKRGHYNSNAVRDALKKIYGDKCAYCEGSPVGTSAFRIDHYRPHRRLKEVEGHHGYFWLYLEWTNLVQSCESCNGVKSNQFPLEVGQESTRICGNDRDATVLTYRLLHCPGLMAERRLLLHPELDIVERHLRFNQNGTVEGLSNMGEKSIDVYGLNRDSLILMRKKKIKNYWHRLVNLLNDYEDCGGDQNAQKLLGMTLYRYFADLLQEQEEVRPYASLGYYMFEEFETFYLSKLPDEVSELRELVKAFYTKVREG